MVVWLVQGYPLSGRGGIFLGKQLGSRTQACNLKTLDGFSKGMRSLEKLASFYFMLFQGDFLGEPLHSCAGTRYPPSW